MGTKTKTSRRSTYAVRHPTHARRIRFATEVLGWYGAAAILIAYTLATFDTLDVHSTPYLILNFTGSIGILTVATAKHVRQSMLINAFWALMAAIALIRIILQT